MAKITQLGKSDGFDDIEAVNTVKQTSSTAYGGELTTEEQNFKQAFESFRAKYKLTMPQLDDALVDGSRQWSVKMRETRQFRHGDSRENIYRGSASGVAAFRAWERSPGHRALLLSPNIVAFGIGQSDGYWTFRARSQERVAVQVNAEMTCENGTCSPQTTVRTVQRQRLFRR